MTYAQKPAFPHNTIGADSSPFKIHKYIINTSPLLEAIKRLSDNNAVRIELEL